MFMEFFVWFVHIKKILYCGTHLLKNSSSFLPALIVLDLTGKLNWADREAFGYDRVKDDYKLLRHLGFSQMSDCDLDVLPWEDISFDSLIWEMIFSIFVLC